MQGLPAEVSATSEETEARQAGNEPFTTRDAAGALTVSAEDVAGGLGISIEMFLVGLRAGIVFQATEQGLGLDAGRRRLTFRFRHRQFQVIVDESGRVVHASRNPG
jgi:hypothetical protein